MTITRDELELLTRELADAVDDPRWPQTLVLQLLDNVFVQEWHDILNAAPYYRFGMRTITLDSNGRFPKTDLNLGSGDSAETHYRILSVQSGQFFYQQSTYQQYPMPSNTYDVSLPQVWYELGTEIQLVPVLASTAVQVGVNWRPTRVSRLQNGNSDVIYPDGYEVILAYMGAKQMLLKGGIEGQYAAQMEAQAKELRDRLLFDVRRIGTRPLVMGAFDSPSQWGG